MKIGVLALQGDFAEHISMLKRLGVETAEVRLPEHLQGLDGLIIPGGESTTIGKLAVAYDLMEPLKQFGQRHAIWGTCAGCDLPFKRYQPRPASAWAYGYQSGAQRVWTPGRFLRSRS